MLALNAEHAHAASYHAVADIPGLNKSLLRWFETVRNDRNMPWRKQAPGGDANIRAYRIWVSEIMLQQTQVSTVLTYWPRWVAALPDVESLARASVEEVHALWAGLGYYSRATRLIEGAKVVMKRFHGTIPQNPQELAEIPGVGPYSAGAIASIAFGARAPLVDGNVTRVLSRLTAFYAPPAAKASSNYVWALADELVSAEDPGSWNQALMELGATVCTPKNPNCGGCPVREWCRASAEGKALKAASRLSSTETKIWKANGVNGSFEKGSNGANQASTTLKGSDGREKISSTQNGSNGAKKSSVTKTKTIPDIEDTPCTLCTPFNPFEMDMPYPMPKVRKAPREEDTLMAIVECTVGTQTHVLLMRRPEKGLLANLYEFPSVDVDPSEPYTTPKARLERLNALLKRLLAEKLGRPDDIRALSPYLHIYSHQKRTYYGYVISVAVSELPKLAAGSGKSKADAVEYESLPGRGRWVLKEDVESENIGGAVKKVWQSAQGVAPEKKKAKVASKVASKRQPPPSKSISQYFTVSPTKKRPKIVISSDEDD